MFCYFFHLDLDHNHHCDRHHFRLLFWCFCCCCCIYDLAMRESGLFSFHHHHHHWKHFIFRFFFPSCDSETFIRLIHFFLLLYIFWILVLIRIHMASVVVIVIIISFLWTIYIVIIIIIIEKNICKAFLLTPRDIIDSIFFSQYDWSKTERRRKKRFLSIDIFMMMMMTMNWMKGISFWKMKIVKFLCKEFLPYCCRCLKVKYEGSGCSLVVVVVLAVVVVELNRTWKFINGIQESKEPYHPFIIYIVFIYSVSWWFHLGNGKLSSMIKQIKKNKTECH